MKYLTLAAAMLLAGPALAASGPVRTVVGPDNVAIPYTVDQRSDGSYLLVSAPRSPSAFRLRVRKNWVNGYVDGTPVSFRVPQGQVVRVAAD